MKVSPENLGTENIAVPPKIDTPMPTNHPEKKNILQKMSDDLRDLSETVASALGIKNTVNPFQEMLAKLTGALSGVDIEKGITVQKASDLNRVREAFRPIVDFDDSAVEINIGDFIVYDKQKGVVNIYPADENSPTKHSETVRDTIVAKWERQIDDLPPIEDKEFEKWGIYYNEKSSKVGQAIGDWLVKNGPSSRYWKGRCAYFCRLHLENFWFKNPPRGHANQWKWMLDKDPRFQLVPISDLSQIPVGGIMTYSGNWKNSTGKNKQYGHVEIKGADNRFYSDYASPTPGGGAKAPWLHNNFEKWKEATGFTGVYLPIGRTKDEAAKYKDAPPLLWDKNSKNDVQVAASSEKLDTNTSLSESEKKFISSELSKLKEKKEYNFKENSQAIIVSAKEQKAYVTKADGTILKTYPVSTAKNGLSNKAWSLGTPTGTLKIAKKIGEWQPKLTSFVWREPKGEIPLATKDTKNDLITSRILTLTGLDRENKNAGQRNIYFHGTNEEFLVGTPASHGCIRMKNDDVIEMFDMVSSDTFVRIA